MEFIIGLVVGLVAGVVFGPKVVELVKAKLNKGV